LRCCFNISTSFSCLMMPLICIFWHQSTFISRRERVSLLSSKTAGVYTCVLLFVQMKVVPSGIWKSPPRMNQTCVGLQFFVGGFSHDVKQRHIVWRETLKYIHRYTSNWLKLCPLTD
jgi:hypothetical protein